MTLQFHDSSIHYSHFTLVKLLIRPNMPTAKECLMKCFASKTPDYRRVEILSQLGLSSPTSQNNPDYRKEVEILSQLGQYTLESIIIHVLAVLFSSIQEFPVVKLATLVDQLEKAVRVQAVVMQAKEAGQAKKVSNMSSPEAEVSGVSGADKTVKKVTRKGRVRKRSAFAFGTNLVAFMVERDLISLSSDLSLTKSVVVKEPGKGYVPSSGYAMCNFDLSILPVKLSLPMICKPLPWSSRTTEVPLTLADLTGGYLSEPTGDLLYRFKLLTSHDTSHFYVKLSNPGYKVMCESLTKLQEQAFEINEAFLEFIKTNYEGLVECGLLKHKELTHVNVWEASNLLRRCYLENKAVSENYSCGTLLKEFYKLVQHARYEDMILNLASAYAGYKIYLPANKPGRRSA